MRRFAFLAVAILLPVGAMAQVPWGEIWQKATRQPAASLSESKITAGLREALKVSANKAVASTGRPDGFWKNEAIRILLPEKLRTAGRGLRLVGLGPQLDELEVGMNRAAEQAVPHARKIFLNTLAQMTITDAREILTGGDTAATDYFRAKSSQALAEAFTPIVHRSLENVGVVRQYRQLMQNSMARTLLAGQRFDLDAYVTQKALDGVFYVLAQEEKEIRQNPAARTTRILREVFGSVSPSR